MKKIIAITAVIVVLAVAAVGGTLAWLTDQDTVTNTFTVGNVQIKLDEAKVGTNGKAILAGQQGAGRVQTNSYHIIPGAVLDKDPTVTVEAGSESCLVYVYIDNGLGNHATLNINTANWSAVSGYSGLYKYIGTVPAVTADTPLPAVFTTVTIEGAALTNATLETLNNEQIIVKAYAIQSENLGSTDTDELAYIALTTP